MPMTARSSLLRTVLVLVLVLTVAGCSGGKGLFKGKKNRNEGVPVG